MRTHHFPRLLSRSWTIEAVAEHLGLSIREAQRFIVASAKSGKVALARKGGGLAPASLTLQQEKTGTSPVSSSAVRQMKLPKVRGPKALADSATVDHKRLHFKLTGAKPHLQATPSQMNLNDMIGRAKQGHMRPGGRAPLSAEIHLLEALSSSPRKITELRWDFGVSRSTLARLVRKGVVKPAWGREGVGLLYEITKSGSQELRRLKDVSSLGPVKTAGRNNTLKSNRREPIPIR